MTEILETFRDASATDLQAAGQAIARMNRRPFCERCTVCTVQHKFWGLLRYSNCAPLLRLSDLIR